MASEEQLEQRGDRGREYDIQDQDEAIRRDWVAEDRHERSDEQGIAAPVEGCGFELTAHPARQGSGIHEIAGLVGHDKRTGAKEHEHEADNKQHHGSHQQQAAGARSFHSSIVADSLVVGAPLLAA